MLKENETTKKKEEKSLLKPYLTRTALFLHKGMQFFPSFRGFRNQQKLLMSIAARLPTEEVPCSNTGPEKYGRGSNSPRVCAMAATF
ncbi:hypothetical protein AVEN_83419-1 [Araneus ventricosus]|uniref:Uncharacterized protein n=1 Tax=Araneus ventricosus TaxID=182803 RepID=A0A4Y2N2C1_ARAVE|nr:hypothetical protein AVEN_83419-1 [Araneus ventricosus]